MVVTPGGLSQPMSIPSQVWEDVSMDFITGLLKAKGYKTIMVAVDMLSEYAHFVPLKHLHTAKTLVDVFMKEVI